MLPTIEKILTDLCIGISYTLFAIIFYTLTAGHNLYIYIDHFSNIDRQCINCNILGWDKKSYKLIMEKKDVNYAGKDYYV